MIRGLDIFCGAGGSSAGARAAGVEIIGAVDKCPIATQTFRHNFPAAAVKTGMLEDIGPGDLMREIGPVDILLSSPECTNHTCAKGSAPRDESSRATAMHVVEYARVFHPRWVVLENVVHMRPWSRYNELKQALMELGYKLAEQIIDASYLGVPQSRRRLFLVADREHKPRTVEISRPTQFSSVESILDAPGTWKNTRLVTPRRAMDTLARADRAFEALGRAVPFLIVYYGSDGSGGWQRLSRPLRTVTTVDRFALVEPGQEGHSIRMLQVPELRRAMGFGESYKLPFGTRRDRVRLLGNGVCPPVMREVVRALISEGCPAQPRLRSGNVLQDAIQDRIPQPA